MALAGFITGSYNGTSDFMTSAQGGAVYIFNDAVGGRSGNGVRIDNLPDSFAQQIDSKLDDGVAALVFHLRAVIRRKERTFFVEWSAMAGISVLAPAASYAAVLRLHALSLLTWFLVVLFNTWRIIIVRRRVARKREEPVDFRSVGRREILYSLIFIALIAGIVRIVVSIPHGGFDR